MKIKLVFDHWEHVGGKPVTGKERVNLSLGQFHSGTTFDGEIRLDVDDTEELEEALESYVPVFLVVK